MPSFNEPLEEDAITLIARRAINKDVREMSDLEAAAIQLVLKRAVDYQFKKGALGRKDFENTTHGPVLKAAPSQHSSSSSGSNDKLYSATAKFGTKKLSQKSAQKVGEYVTSKLIKNVATTTVKGVGKILATGAGIVVDVMWPTELGDGTLKDADIFKLKAQKGQTELQRMLANKN